MKARYVRLALFTGAVSLLVLSQAQAVSLDSLKEKAGDTLSSGGGSQGGGGAALLSSLSSGSFDFASLENVSGVLSYCQEHGYLGSNSDIIKGKVLDQLGMETEPEENSSYQQGVEGILKGDDGRSLDLSSLGDQAGEKACGLVADQAMSYVGG